MTVSKRSWHARLYQWWAVRRYGHTVEHANLCNYVRVVLLWSWLSWLLKNGKIGRFNVPVFLWVWFLLWLPFGIGRWSYNAMMVVRILYGVTAGLGLLLLIIAGIHWLFSETGAGDALKDTAAGFVEVVIESASSAHSRICPAIEIR